MAKGDNGNNNNYDPTLGVIGSLQDRNDRMMDTMDRMLRYMENQDRLSRANNPRNNSQSAFRDMRDEMQRSANSRKRASADYRRTGNPLEDFETGIKDALLDTIVGGDFKKKMKGAMSTFANEFNTELKDLPHELGKQLSKKAFDNIKNSKFGKDISDKVTSGAIKKLNGMFDGKGADAAAAKSAILKVGQSLFSGTEAGAAFEAAGAATASTAAAGTATAGSAMAGLVGVIGPALAAAAPVIVGIGVALAVIGPALKGIAGILGSLGKSFNREQEMQRKRNELAQKRLQADIEYMVKEPFEILQNAAKEWEQTWDSNLAKVSLTQGYTKEDVYDLYSSVAERLISEGLSSVIPATEVISKLNTVLDSGLSGRIAEEFAYEATKLEAAIPNQSFTGYAATYAQLASEAVANGASQAEAIAYANQQLEQFASNLLYSSRNLAGGFTTGLKDAQNLFTSAVEIAQTAKTSNAAAISGTLTSVSAIIGSVAPDLASGLVNNIVNAAVGGNADSIVALRSLAGINAGNTEFLQALASNPQGIFVDIFRSLANMQNMSPDNYMEVAEGLSSVFGVDMKAFARVDFNALADKIAQMDINSATLDENIQLLASGEATTSTEQLKLQEINNMILEEGLAYVIDSEAGRMIQQHMWDEQMAAELESATYAVDLQGSALSCLQGLMDTVTNVLRILNPIGLIADGVSNMVATVQESIDNRADIEEILQRGAVGTNSRSLYNLTTSGQDLQLVTSLVEMMGGRQGGGTLSNALSGLQQGLNIISEGAAYGSFAMNAGGLVNGFNNLTGSNIYDVNSFYDYINTPQVSDFHGSTSRSSLYSGFNISKSVANAIASNTATTTLGAISRTIASNATENAIAESNKHFQSWLDSAEEASKSMSYENWLTTARDYGIADYAEALSNYGKTESEIKAYFDANQAREGALQEAARKEDEQNFRDETRKFWDYESGTSGIFQTAMWAPFLNENFKPFFDLGGRYDKRMDIVDLSMSEANTTLTDIDNKIGDAGRFTVISVLTAINDNIQNTFVSTSSTFQKCLADWIRYISDVNDYTNTISNANAWNELQNAESDRNNETLLALANAMNEFSAEQLSTLDPTLQTNVLLGKIVIILEAIMQQNNTGGMSMIDTMSALGLGATFHNKIG